VNAFISVISRVMRNCSASFVPASVKRSYTMVGNEVVRRLFTIVHKRGVDLSAMCGDCGAVMSQRARTFNAGHRPGRDGVTVDITGGL
jgi:hypothetical protein